MHPPSFESSPRIYDPFALDHRGSTDTSHTSRPSLCLSVLILCLFFFVFLCLSQLDTPPNTMPRLPTLCLLSLVFQSIPLAIAREVRFNNEPALAAQQLRHDLHRRQIVNATAVDTVTQIQTNTVTTDCPESSITAALSVNPSPS